MFNNILCSTNDGIATITVHRPAVRNALNVATIEELGTAFEQAGADPGVRVVILTGSGDKAFVAGADIAELSGLSNTSGSEFALRGQAVFNRIETLGKPVIAAVNGYALGGGCELALACTLRIASQNAMFGQPEVKLGLMPGFGGSQRLPRLIARGDALQILLTGEMVSAAEAFRIGLVNAVVPQEELMAAAAELAAKIMVNAPVAVRSCLDAVHRGLDMSLQAGQALEAGLFGLCCATDDMKEGTLAFLEKRSPNFRNK